MGTEILKSFGVLQSELEQAKTSLKGFDENIKRLIGRDPSEVLPRPGMKRGIVQQEDNRGRQRMRSFGHENDESLTKRRNVSVFKRLAERPVHHEEEQFQQPHKQMISKVIVTSREVPSRQEALAAQNSDEKFKARNRRMFGALLGTLQKFQQEESKLKVKEAKRAQVEKKIEEHEIREKAEIKKERQELFFNRKRKQAEIKMIELKMNRMKEYAVWEEQQKPRRSFICTKARPHIYYLPRKLNDTSKSLLETSKEEVEKLIEKRKEEISAELQHIEDRMKKNFENRKMKDKVEVEVEMEQDEEITKSDVVVEKNDSPIIQNENEMEEVTEKSNNLNVPEEGKEETNLETAGSESIEKAPVSEELEMKNKEKVEEDVDQNHIVEQQDTDTIGGD